jgi:threonine dehydrogenase-like Zn-dependent dehydrogenase
LGRRNEHLLEKASAPLCFVTCGTCLFCRTGRENLCRNTIHIGHGAGWGVRPYYPGAMAEYCPMWARQCFELPDSMSFEEAALLDPLQVAVHAIDVSGLRAGDTFAVFGLGSDRRFTACRSRGTRIG